MHGDGMILVGIFTCYCVYRGTYKMLSHYTLYGTPEKLIQSQIQSSLNETHRDFVARERG